MSEVDRDKWDKRYREQGVESRTPHAFLTGLASVLPRKGRALDVAGGSGRNAIWLARHGLDVTLVDISREGLALARSEAAAAGVHLELALSDLETEPLPAGPFDVVFSANFLRRALFAEFPRVLAPGGLLVFVQPTRKNLERNPRPPAPFLLDDAELPRLIQGLEIEAYEEAWFPSSDGQRHEAHLLARKPRTGGA
jgi:SAM-dependent methyltransferase